MTPLVFLDTLFENGFVFFLSLVDLVDASAGVLVETYYEADAEDPWEYIWVGFTGTPPMELEDVYTIPQAVRIFEHMKACHSLHKGKMEFILAKLWELFSFLMEETEDPIDPVDTALNLIHAEYMTPLTVQHSFLFLQIKEKLFEKIMQAQGEHRDSGSLAR